MMRAKEEKDIKSTMENQGLLSYNQQLLEEFRNSSNEVYIVSRRVHSDEFPEQTSFPRHPKPLIHRFKQMSEQVDDVHVSCEEDLTVECDQTFEILTWSFEVETEVRLLF